jgi:hypothetical protein
MNTLSFQEKEIGACLLHCEWVYDLATVVGQLGGFFGRDDRDEPRSRYLARVSRKDSVDFFPYLHLGCTQASS